MKYAYLKKNLTFSFVLGVSMVFAMIFSVQSVHAQTSGTGFQNEDGTYDGVYELPPFEVTASQDDGMQYDYTYDDFIYDQFEVTYDDWVYVDPCSYTDCYADYTTTYYDNPLDTGLYGEDLIFTGGGGTFTTTTDVCPNISGDQSTVPDGMIVDGSGYCVYPTVTDVCPNIDGAQGSVPYGYEIDGNGNCVATVPPLVDSVPVGVLDSATCSTVNGWAYDPDTSPTTTYVPPSTSATACWQTPSAVVVDGYTRCQQSGACTAGGTADSKCLDADGNMEQPPGRDYCIEVSSLDDVDCNRPVPYTPTTAAPLSCFVGFYEPANTLGISNHQGEGTRILGNQSSANFACQKLGYNSAIDFTTKGFNSCGDNQLAYDGGGFWAYGDACALGNSGISYVKCAGTGAICENKCGNGVIDSGEQCDGNSSVNYDRCAEPTWYCSSTCSIISSSLGPRELCP